MKVKFVVILVFGLLLTACSAGATATALPTVVLEEGQTTNTQSPVSTTSGRQASASGFVVAAQEARLSFTQSGSLKAVNFSAGDEVKAGDLLAELDNTALLLEVASAERTLKELTSPAAQASAAQALAKN